MQVVVLLLLLEISLTRVNATALWSMRSLVRRKLATALMVFTTSIHGCRAYEEFGDTSSSVGSVSLNPFASASDIEAARARARLAAAVRATETTEATSSTSEMDEVLKLIPSVKYFKIIADEYSRRSADYDGSANMLMPLM